MTAVTLATGVHRIPTMGDFINSFVFTEVDGSVTLVDTGTRFASGRIVAGLAELGKSPEDVQRIILTHAHTDHAGSVADMVSRSGLTGATVHELDAEYVRSGTAPPLEDRPVAKVFARVPGMGWKPCAVSDTLVDRQLLDIGGGLRVHHTPGHTPGHISLLHEPTGVLITGDAIFNMAGRMTWPVRTFCTDFPLTTRTAAVFADLEYDLVAFTHGPHITDNARETVRGFLRRKGVVA